MPRNFRKKISGFLLIEAVLAMAILVIVTTGVYKIMQATLQSTSEMRRNHLEDQEINAMTELLRNIFRSLPNEALLYSRTTQDAGRSYPGLVFEKSPSAFAFGTHTVYFGPQVLEIRPQIGGLFNLSLTLEPELSLTGQPIGNETLPSLELIRDVRSLEWKFYNAATDEWVLFWEDSSTRPQLIQLTMGIAGNTTPVVAVFSVSPKLEVTPPSGSQRNSNNRTQQQPSGNQPFDPSRNGTPSNNPQLRPERGVNPTP